MSKRANPIPRGIRVGDRFKSAHSNSNSNCVEVERTDDVTFIVRNTKQGQDGPAVTFTLAEWTAFIEGVKDGEFDPTAGSGLAFTGAKHAAPVPEPATT